LGQGRHRATIAEINRKAHSTGISAIADRWSQLSGVASPARSNTLHEGYQRTIMPNKNRKILSQKNHLTQIALGESSGVEIQASVMAGMAEPAAARQTCFTRFNNLTRQNEQICNNYPRPNPPRVYSPPTVTVVPAQPQSRCRGAILDPIDCPRY
jgi:hypothetical protein